MVNHVTMYTNKYYKQRENSRKDRTEEKNRTAYYYTLQHSNVFCSNE